MALGALALAGCGSSGSSGHEGDPASVVPASAPLYVSAVVRPTGSLEKNAVTVARKLTHLSDPFGSLLKSLQSEGKTHFNFSELKPWLGERAGLFITSIGGSGSPLSALEHGLSGNIGGAGSINKQETQGALVLDVTDRAKAQAFLTAQAGHSSHTASYQGISYLIDSEKDAMAIVGGFAVIGSEAGLKAVIDTTRGGPALSRDPGYGKLSSLGRAGSLAHVYVRPAVLFSSIRTRSKEDAQDLATLRQLLRRKTQDYISLVPTANSIEIDAAATPPESAAQTRALSAAILAGLPGSSWLALGIGNFGELAEQELGTLQGLSSSLKGASPLSGLLGPLSAKGVNLKRDFLNWMGSAGLFLGGASLLNTQAAVVIESKEPARSRAAVGEIARLVAGSGGSSKSVSIAGTDAASELTIKSLPFRLYAADGHGKFILGLGETSVQQALSPSSTLASSPAYRAARSALGGMEPSLILEFQSLVSLLEGLQLQNSESLGKVLPYLRSLGTLTAGSENLGEVELGRLVLTLQ